MHADHLLLGLVADQHGFATRHGARSVGLTKAALAHRLAGPEWEVHGRRVLRRAGAPWTKASPLMRAVLDAGPGAVLSHGTAASWWGLPGFDLRTIHVTRPRGLTSARVTYADVLHAVLDLSTDQVTVLNGIPIVRPERLLFELCAAVHPLRAERALNKACAKNLCSADSLRRIHAQLAGRGREGTCVMRELLEARPPGWVPPESNLEARFEHILAGTRLGPFRRQVDVGDDLGWCGRVDFLHSILPVIVEVQSEHYHAALLDVAADARRRARQEAAGFVVAEVWDTQVWYHKDEAIAAVRTAVRVAEARRRRAA